jgi:hypothetical protein
MKRAFLSLLRFYIGFSHSLEQKRACFEAGINKAKAVPVACGMNMMYVTFVLTDHPLEAPAGR